MLSSPDGHVTAFGTPPGPTTRCGALASSERDVDERGAVVGGAGQHLLGSGRTGLGEAQLGLDEQGQQADVAGGGEAGDLGMRQHPGDGGVDPLLVVERLIPVL